MPPLPGRPSLTIPHSLDAAHDVHGVAIAQAFAAAGGGAQAPAGLRYILLVFTNRSGSTYLGDLLATTGFFNYPVEVLNAEDVVSVSQARGFTSFAQYFFTVAAEQARNGYFVFKSSIGQVAVLAAHGLLQPILDQAHFVVVERMDKLAQAVSWQIAVQTGLFTSLQDADGRPSPTYDRDVIRDDIERFARQGASTSLFMGLNGIVPLHLTYELVTSQPRFAIRLLCTFVGAPPLECHPAQVRLQKQATETNAQWCRQFLDQR